ncbi:unnamed protein product [Rotaria sordida]|uniref:Uncharacterized protein n=1 Tax=Rotaria sordida TaxID=392033 RepID=A0A819Z1D8_9BILA|nr:unnamed protein product [Rotaria sordida]CAF4165194.1 unnamed protein product [Rotaria sordida]
MAKAVIADHDNFLTTEKINVETKKCHSFPHTFQRTYLTTASITSYQSSDYPSAFHNHSSYDGSVPTRGARRGGEGGTKSFF